MSLITDTPQSGPCRRVDAFDPSLVPESTKSYQALPNKDFLDMIDKAAQEHKMVLTEEQLAMDLKGMRFFGTWKLSGMDFLNNKVNLMLGAYNSYDKSLRARICVGSKVMVCSNLCFHAYADEMGFSCDFGHKHTVNLNQGLWGRIMDSFANIPLIQQNQERFFNALRNKVIDTPSVHSLIVRAAQNGVVNKTNVVDIANEWDNHFKYPNTEDEYKNWQYESTEPSWWNLFNCFTQIGKKKFDRNQVAAGMESLRLTRFFHEEVGLG